LLFSPLYCSFLWPEKFHTARLDVHILVEREIYSPFTDLSKTAATILLACDRLSYISEGRMSSSLHLKMMRVWYNLPLQEGQVRLNALLHADISTQRGV
jgi:hypothetical protein